MARVRFTPEDTIILALCGRTASRARLERLACDPRVDWRRVAKTAKAHRVAPLLFSRALELPLPPPVRDAVAREGRQAVAESLHDSLVFREELGQILRALAPSGIPSVLLKGLSLDPSMLRSTGDIDLLVPRERLVDAIDAVLEIPGYHFSESPRWGRMGERRRHGSLGAAARARIVEKAEMTHELQLYHTARGILLELHVALFKPEGRREDGAWGAASGRAVVERVWSRRRPNPDLGCDVPCAEHSLLLMCLHAALKRSPANHLFRLGVVADIETLASSGIRWDLFTCDCVELGLAPLALFSLQLARRLLGTSVPHHVLAELARGCTRLQLMLTRFHLRCVASLDATNAIYSAVYRALQPWAFGGSWREKLRWSTLAPLWAPSRERMAGMLGVAPDSPHLFLGYLLNSLRWAHEALGRLRRS